MSRRAPHLMRRGSVYWFRYRVPANLRRAFGRGEVKRSLLTGCYREDILRSATVFARVFSLCKNGEVMKNLTAEQFQTMVTEAVATAVANSALAGVTQPNSQPANTSILYPLASPPAAISAITIADALDRYWDECAASWAEATRTDAKLAHAWIRDDSAQRHRWQLLQSNWPLYIAAHWCGSKVDLKQQTSPQGRLSCCRFHGHQV